MKARTAAQVMVLTIAAAAAAASLGTEFTYQGVLSDAGVPASGAFDLRFLLYDADVGGSQVGGIVYVENLTVTDGRMTAQLDFGAVFDGTALWLEVGVRDGASTGSYTVLSPRHELTAAPFAQHALAAATANTAGEADTLDGEHGSYYLTWSNFVGIPGDLANGDDDTLQDLACAPDEIVRWSGTAWNCSIDVDTPYARTYIVGPVGTPAQNGTALRNAVNAITPPTAQEEAVLLVVEPGTYDVGATALPIWAWMTIEGAGEELTVIIGAVCDPTNNNGTIRSTSEHIGLRRLAVENTCADFLEVGVAIDSEGDSATLEHVTARAVGFASTDVAIHNTGSNLKMEHVTVTTENGYDNCFGLINTGADAYLQHLTARVDGSGNTTAVDNSGANFTLRQSDLRAFGTSICTAILNTGDNFAIRNVIADASPIACLGTGINSNYGSGTIEDVRALGGETGIRIGDTGPGGVVLMHGLTVEGNTGVLCFSPSVVRIGHSWIHGDSTSVARSGGSMTLQGVILDGGPVWGIPSCTGCIRGTTFAAAGCP